VTNRAQKDGVGREGRSDPKELPDVVDVCDVLRDEHGARRRRGVPLRRIDRFERRTTRSREQPAVQLNARELLEYLLARRIERRATLRLGEHFARTITHAVTCEHGAQCLGLQEHRFENNERFADEKPFARREFFLANIGKRRHARVRRIDDFDRRRHR